MARGGGREIYHATAGRGNKIKRGTDAAPDESQHHARTPRHTLAGPDASRNRQGPQTEEITRMKSHPSTPPARLRVARPSAAFLAALLSLFALSQAAQAATVFDDRAAFLAAPSARATQPFRAHSKVPPQGPSFTLGELTFTKVPATRNLRISDYSTRIGPDSLEMASDEKESFDVDVAGPVSPFGFDFVEAEHAPWVVQAFMESTFVVTLKLGTDTVDSFSFSAPNDVAYFVGVWTNEPFNRVEIREVVGGAENEFFGQFYLSDVSQGPSASQLLIKRAQANAALTQLTISGENFGKAAPAVAFEGSPLALVSHTQTQLVATLPAGVQPGSYLLNVSRGQAPTESDSFDVTLGAVGPKGEKGDKGDKGH